jgi:hypothetical protein
MSDKPNDSLAVGGWEMLTSFGQAGGQAVDPKPAIWIQHDLDDGRILEPGRNGRPERSA